MDAYRASALELLVMGGFLNHYIMLNTCERRYRKMAYGREKKTACIRPFRLDTRNVDNSHRDLFLELKKFAFTKLFERVAIQKCLIQIARGQLEGSTYNYRL